MFNFLIAIKIKNSNNRYIILKKNKYLPLMDILYLCLTFRKFVNSSLVNFNNLKHFC